MPDKPLPRRTPSDDPSKPRFQAKVEKTPIGVDDDGKEQFITVPVDEPCDACAARVGSTCQECGAILCAECNKHPHAEPGHEPDAHLTEPVTAASADKRFSLVFRSTKESLVLAGGVVLVDAATDQAAWATLVDGLHHLGVDLEEIDTPRVFRNALNALQKS